MKRELVNIDGLEVWNNPEDRAFRDRLDGVYERDGINFMQVREPTLLIDVGARCGWYGFHAAAHGAYPVFYEPSATTELIEDSLQKNRLLGDVFQVCASDHNGTVTLTDTRGEFYEPEGEGEEVEVECVRLDEHIPDNGLGGYLSSDDTVGVKIDTEGQEYEVIKGMSGIVESIDFAIVEFHPEKSDTVEQAERLMEEWGFTGYAEKRGSEKTVMYSK